MPNGEQVVQFEVRSPGVRFVQWLYVLGAPMLTSLLVRTSPPGPTRATSVAVALSIAALVLAWSYRSNLHVVITADSTVVSRALGPLRSRTEFLNSAIHRVELPNYRNVLIVHLKTGAKVRVANPYSIVRGKLPDREFHAGIAHGHRRQLRRLMRGLEELAGIQETSADPIQN